MLGPLASELHERQVTSDHNKMIFETVEDVFIDEEGDRHELGALDNLLDEDAESISSDELEKLEEVIDAVVDDEEKNITRMTKEEIQKLVSSSENITVSDLDS